MKKLKLALGVFVAVLVALCPSPVQASGCADCGYYEGLAFCTAATPSGAFDDCEVIYRCNRFGVCLETCRMGSPCFWV